MAVEGAERLRNVGLARLSPSPTSASGTVSRVNDLVIILDLRERKFAQNQTFRTFMPNLPLRSALSWKLMEDLI